MSQFLSGATAMGYLIAAAFFLRFFSDTTDRLFAMFAAAFAILGINRIAVAVVNPADEASQTGFYVIRLIAFVVILVAIVDKNRRRSERYPGARARRRGDR